MSEQKTQLPPSPEQMALEITTAIIAAGYFDKHEHFRDQRYLDNTMRAAKNVYKAALLEFKKV